MRILALLLVSFCPILLYPQSSVPTSQVPQQLAAPPPSSPGLSQPGYLLGPGDTVKITVWTGNEYLQENLTVAPDGTLFIPFFVNKLINVTGLTTSKLRDLVQSELHAIFQRPIVQIITLGFESQKAFLVGEVQNAGQFSIFGSVPILEFIVQHGGFSSRANLAAVQVTRTDGRKETTNIYDIVLKGDQSKNILVNPGDIVFVPSLETVAKTYFVLGEVRAPQVLHSPEDLTLLEVISRAGTLSTSAQAKHVFVVRPEGSEIMDINFSDIYKKGDFSRNVVLKSGDVVYVPKSGRARVADVVNAVTPILSFLRDSLILVDIAKRQ
ncbi:MAG: polysaccharide biosynthesis/export family protein [Acidobacteria bacterium]|nr:polysaccharide biosynthesis/export family protein [Acidobacteriota bacterium]